MKIGTIKSNLKFIKQLILVLCCLSFFLYQFQIVLVNYLSGKTVVNIKLTNGESDTIPGLTICYDKLFSFEKMIKKLQKYQGDWNS